MVVVFMPFYRQFFVLRLSGLQRNPSSLGLMMSYVCASKQLCEDLVPVAGMSERAREKYFQSLGGDYAFGTVGSTYGRIAGVERLDSLSTGRN